MSKVKMFDFPSFGNWFENGCEYEGRLGEFNVSICPFSLNSHITNIGFAVAANLNPLNIYSHTVWSRRYQIDWHDKDHKEKLKNWYNSIIKEFAEFWEKYINDTYLA